MDEQEAWKDIDGYEGYYQVSDRGNVKSLVRPIYGKGGCLRSYTTERRLAQSKNTFGYSQVTLCKDGKSRNITVHRLVAETFLPNPHGLEQVNHKDENKDDNRIANLEWCTPQYNMRYGKAPKIRAEKRSKPVKQMSLDGELIATFVSARQASAVLGFSYKHISACCLGKRTMHMGYGWAFA